MLVLRGESANLLSVGAIDFGLHRRCHRHHGGEHLPPSRPGDRQPAAPLRERAAGSTDCRQAARDLCARRRGQQGDLLLRPASSSPPSSRCSPWAGSRATSSARCRRPMPMPSSAACWRPSPSRRRSARILLREHVRESDTRVVRALHCLYTPALHFAVANRVLAIAGVAAAAVLPGVAVRRSGRIPADARGRQPVGPRHHAGAPSRSRKATARQPHARASLRTSPRSITAISQHGRPDDGTDAAGFFNAEFFVPLKPPDQWPSARRQGRADRKSCRTARGRIPRRRVQLLAISAGQRGRGGLGRERRQCHQALRQRSRIARPTRRTRSRQVMATVPGIADLAVFRSLGQPTVQIDSTARGRRVTASRPATSTR